MKVLNNFTLLVYIILLFPRISAQPGKDGNYTVQTPDQILNKYCPVMANISSGTNSLVLAHAALVGLCPGDLIMIYQAQGANMNSSNTSSYGDISSYNNAGIYEFKYVQSVTGNTVLVQSTFSNSFNVSGKTQAVKVPQFVNLSINPAASVVAKNWQDTTINSISYRLGGILVIHAQQIINNGLISANGAGFRGGNLINDSGINTGANGFCTSFSSQGAEKGESVAGNSSDYDGNGGRYGMGAPANGGGGGNNHNAGGGGGANGWNGNSWNGQGVMVVNSNNPLSAWSLSSAYVANNNSLCNSSGGGRGGYSWADFNGNALLQGPGNPVWIGDLRREVGGFGGRPLNNIDAETRIYFGGGGGAPHQNNSTSQAGSNGGGIVYLIASGGITGSGYITANGIHAGSSTGCSCDAAPGAGAGGSIVIKTTSISLSQNLRATGGNGGNQMSLTPPGNNLHESEGPGGGGGGGYIAVSASGPLQDVSGGLNGTSLSNAITEMNSNGSTSGASGQTGTVSTSFISYSPVPSFSIGASANPQLVCSGQPVTLTGTGAISYSWQPGSLSGNPIIIHPLQSTIYTVTGEDMNGCKSSNTVAIELRPAPLINVSATQTLICPGHSLTFLASGAVIYTWQPGNLFGNPVSVTPLSSMIYIVSGQDASGCIGNGSVSITVAPCLGEHELKNSSFLPEIYPNPGSGRIQIRITEKRNYSLKLFNSLGQLVKAFSYQELEEMHQVLDLSELPSGSYHVEFQSQNEFYNKKLLLNP